MAILSSGSTTAALADDAQSQQWYLSAMKADGMWKESTGEGIKVAVIDTGVNPDTPSLKGQVLTDEVPEALAFKATEDYVGHGTTMAELIAGTGAGGGLKGLAPGAKIVPYRIATKELKGAEAEKAPKVADIIRAVADSDVKIMSMSFGNHNENEDELAAIRYAQSKGKLMIAGAGNDAEKKNLIGYPAAYRYVVGVAATDESGKAASFSEHGNYVDLAAPGLNMPVWCDSNFRAYCDEGGGTSSATALTSASAALIWSAHPDWTANQVLNSLIDTAGRDWARDDPSTYLGYGLIRPRKVLEDKGYNPGPANADPLAKENATGALDEAGNPVSAASSAPSTEPSNESKDTSDDQTPAAASDAETDASDSTTLWVTLGAAAAVLVIGGAAFAVHRSRRSA
uniref:S8 family serine peptidase n=1 Tax=Streptomyces sp. CHD11 TaxID=2741325 RepID=UPI0027E54D81|nr:S8 family serine peptidase [Streptomyces sp. CHD11]